MADPLSTTASIIAILQATSVAVTYVRGVLGAKKDMESLIKELGSLQIVLTSLQEYARANPDSTRLQTFDTPLKECNSDITKLYDKLVKGISGGVQWRLVGKRFRGFQWPLLSREYSEYLNKMEHLKSDILIAMGLDRDERDLTLQQNERRKKILKWLNPTVHNERHHEISTRRQLGTGTWLLKEVEVVDWVEGDPPSPLLLGYGIPGAGKTFLSSGMIDYLLKLQTAANWGVAFMYFDHTEQRQQTPALFLSSVVKQFTSQIDHVPEEVNKLYDELQDKQAMPTFEQLYLMLLTVIKPFTQAFVVCDALDECDKYTQRSKLLPLFNQMGKDGVRLFLTSREHREDIQHGLQSAVKIKLWAKDEDIKAYIEREIAENPGAERLVGQAKCKEEIISELQTCANGMSVTWANYLNLADILWFLLVHFHIRYLCEQTTPRQLLEALRTLKVSTSGESPMDRTYNRAMETIEKSQTQTRVTLAVKILTWLVKSQRVLTVHELQQAVSVEQHYTEFDKLALPDEKTMLDVCASLVTIDQESNTMRLVHYTAKEYLINNSIIAKDAEFRILKACVTFLSYRDFSEGPCTTEALLEHRYEIYPFLRYAGMNFASHLQQCDEALCLGLALEFVKKTQNMLSYIQASRYFNIQKYLDMDKECVSLVCLGVHLQQASVIQRLLKEGEDVSGSHFMGQTALSIAIELGCVSIIEVLLENGASIFDTDLDGRTALYTALDIFCDVNGVVKVLLEKTDVSARDNKGHPLLHMVVGCYENCAEGRLLLKRGADVSATDNKGVTPLHIAASSASIESMEFLLENGADVWATDNEGQIPLHDALNTRNDYGAKLLLGKMLVSDTTHKGEIPLHITAFEGGQSSVAFLLKIGAGVSAMASGGQAPLHITLSEPLACNVVGFHIPLHQDIEDKDYDNELIRVLLGKADVSARDGKGHTALHVAAGASHPCPDGKEVRSLLERGADVSATDFNGQTPLHIAAACGALAAVRLLLENGADIWATDNKGGTAGRRTLRWRTVGGRTVEGGWGFGEDEGGWESGEDEELLEILFDKIDMSATDFKGQTPLHIATSLGQQERVGFLLGKGADVSATDNEGQTPLHIAASCRSQDVAGILLENGADVSAKDNKGRTPLHYAVVQVAKTFHYAAIQAVAVAKTLVEKGADVSATDNKGQTPLHIAASWDVAGILLENGADVSAKDNKGQTPLHIAVSCGSLGVAIILFENGADVSAKDNKGRTPLHYADVQVARPLIEKGADVSATDNEGRTPLHLAALSWRQDRARFLLENGADVSAKDNKGWTPLHYAAVQEIAKTLVEKGADVSATDNEGQTPLHHAASRKNQEVVSILIQGGADVLAMDNKVRTPLDIAVLNGNEEVVRVLHENGTDAPAKDDEGGGSLPA